MQRKKTKERERERGRKATTKSRGQEVETYLCGHQERNQKAECGSLRDQKAKQIRFVWSSSSGAS
jgi:hypothetical protein